jgi:hypothetical protein
VLVAFLAANESFVDLDHSRERFVERFGPRRFTEPVGHEPSCLLRNADITSELSARDPLFVTGNQPNGGRDRRRRPMPIGREAPFIEIITITKLP